MEHNTPRRIWWFFDTSSAADGPLAPITRYQVEGFEHRNRLRLYFCAILAPGEPL